MTMTIEMMTARRNLFFFVWAMGTELWIGLTATVFFPSSIAAFRTVNVVGRKKTNLNVKPRRLEENVDGPLYVNDKVSLPGFHNCCSFRRCFLRSVS